jgi:hypothetical protein
LQWCYIIVHENGNDTTLYSGDTYYTQAGQTLKFDFIIKNNGTESVDMGGCGHSIECGYLFTFKSSGWLATIIPPDGSCITIENVFQIVISSSASSGDECTFKFTAFGIIPDTSPPHFCRVSDFPVTIEIQ